MVNFRLFREEVLHRSVRGIKRLTPFAEDVDVCLIINKNLYAQLVDTPPPDSENVFQLRCRWLVTQGSEQKGNWNWSYPLPKDSEQSLQKSNKRTHILIKPI
jgi:hypothetical protein